MCLKQCTYCTVCIHDSHTLDITNKIDGGLMFMSETFIFSFLEKSAELCRFSYKKNHYHYGKTVSFDLELQNMPSSLHWKFRPFSHNRNVTCGAGNFLLGLFFLTRLKVKDFKTFWKKSELQAFAKKNQNCGIRSHAVIKRFKLAQNEITG